jgi:hypothetical protein
MIRNCIRDNGRVEPFEQFKTFQSLIVRKAVTPSSRDLDLIEFNDAELLRCAAGQDRELLQRYARNRRRR